MLIFQTHLSKLKNFFAPILGPYIACIHVFCAEEETLAIVGNHL